MHLKIDSTCQRCISCASSMTVSFSGICTARTFLRKAFTKRCKRRRFLSICFSLGVTFRATLFTLSIKAFGGKNASWTCERWILVRQALCNYNVSIRVQRVHIRGRNSSVVSYIFGRVQNCARQRKNNQRTCRAINAKQQCTIFYNGP